MEEGKGHSPVAGLPYSHSQPPPKLFPSENGEEQEVNSGDIVNCPFCFILEVIMEVWKMYKA